MASWGRPPPSSGSILGCADLRSFGGGGRCDSPLAMCRGGVVSPTMRLSSDWFTDSSCPKLRADPHCARRAVTPPSPRNSGRGTSNCDLFSPQGAAIALSLFSNSQASARLRMRRSSSESMLPRSMGESVPCPAAAISRTNEFRTSPTFQTSIAREAEGSPAVPTGQRACGRKMSADRNATSADYQVQLSSRRRSDSHVTAGGRTGTRAARKNGSQELRRRLQQDASQPECTWFGEKRHDRSTMSAGHGTGVGGRPPPRCHMQTLRWSQGLHGADEPSEGFCAIRNDHVMDIVKSAREQAEAWTPTSIRSLSVVSDEDEREAMMEHFCMSRRTAVRVRAALESQSCSASLAGDEPLDGAQETPTTTQMALEAPERSSAYVPFFTRHDQEARDYAFHALPRSRASDKTPGSPDFEAMQAQFCMSRRTSLRLQGVLDAERRRSEGVPALDHKAPQLVAHEHRPPRWSDQAALPAGERKELVAEIARLRTELAEVKDDRYAKLLGRTSSPKQSPSRSPRQRSPGSRKSSPCGQPFLCDDLAA